MRAVQSRASVQSSSSFDGSACHARARIHTQKKTIVAPQRFRPDVVGARCQFVRRQKRMAVEELVFVDESGCHPGIGPLRGWAPRGSRLVGPEQVYARKQHVSIIGALSLDGIIARMTVQGGVGTQDLHRFVETRLAPVLVPGQIVYWDNLNAHKNKKIRSMIEECGASVSFLPAYSPDLNPIEDAWSKIKHFIRKYPAFTIAGLRRAIYRAYRKVTASDAAGWFRHCGYRVTESSSIL